MAGHGHERRRREIAVNRWCVRYDGYDPDAEPLREALCTLANGYLGTRAAAPESVADGTHYPGTYVAGLYDRQSTDVDGHTVENEDLVNVPNWLPMTFRIDEDGEWFGEGCAELLLYRQELDMQRGVLTGQLRLRDARGRVSRVTQRRFVSMHDPHALALETTIVAENWSGLLTVRSGLDGRVTNGGVARYRDLERRHLSGQVTGHGGDSVWLSATTSGSGGTSSWPHAPYRRSSVRRVGRNSRRVDRPTAGHRRAMRRHSGGREGGVPLHSARSRSTSGTAGTGGSDPVHTRAAQRGPTRRRDLSGDSARRRPVGHHRSRPCLGLPTMSTHTDDADQTSVPVARDVRPQPHVPSPWILVGV